MHKINFSTNNLSTPSGMITSKYQPGACDRKNRSEHNKKGSGMLPCSLEGGMQMATRDSMEKLMQQCEDAIRFAREEFKESSLQQQYNNDDYTTALQGLEQTYNDLAKMALNANAQQRDQLHRMRLQLQEMQNQMILQGYR